jgi:hypothetical protein
VYTWGQGKGQLGHVKVCDEWTPKKVAKLAGYSVSHIVCGWKHMLAIATPQQGVRNN